MTVKIQWNAEKFIKQVGVAADNKLKEVAESIANDARALCPVDTGSLRDSIEVRESKFKEGGYIVGAQLSGNYDRFYASFVELGTSKNIKRRAQPFLRPALKKNISRMKREFDNL